MYKNAHALKRKNFYEPESTFSSAINTANPVGLGWLYS